MSESDTMRDVLDHAEVCGTRPSPKHQRSVAESDARAGHVRTCASRHSAVLLDSLAPRQARQARTGHRSRGLMLKPGGPLRRCGSSALGAGRAPYRATRAFSPSRSPNAQKACSPRRRPPSSSGAERRARRARFRINTPAGRVSFLEQIE